jgi:hypothetical protein
MPQPSNNSGPIEDGAINKDGILDLLNEEPEVLPLVDDKKESVKEPVKEGEEEEDDDKEKKEDEIKLVEDEDEEEPVVDEDELEIIAPARRSEILKAYPDLFKKFPHLEKAYYRDQKYSEMFGTIQDAEQVVETAKEYSKFQESVGRGSTKEILEAVKSNNPESFARIVDSYLGTLREVDEKAFFHVFANTIKTTAGAMAAEAKASNNDDLLTAARIMYQYVMGTSNYTGPTSFAKEKSPDDAKQDNELNQERLEFFRERFETVQTDLQSRVDGVLKNTIDQNMDPKNSMTGYVKKVAVTEAMDIVKQQIGRDTGFRRLLDRLWEKAADDKFSKASTEKIRSAYLAKAKTLLPAAIKKTRNDALRGLGKRVREDSESTTTNTSSKRESASAPQTLRGNNNSGNPSKGKTTLQFLNED